MPTGARRAAVAVGALMAGMGAAIALASSGGLDPSFGTAGTTVLTDRPTYTYPTPAAVDSGGKIVLMTSANDQITVSRMLADGSPDPSFGTNGRTVLDAAPKLLRGYAMAVEPDGKVVVAGSISNSAPGTDAAVWRLTAGGQPDPTFSGDGLATMDSGTEDYAFAVAVRPDGRIVASGQSYTSPGPPLGAIWQLTSTGQPDPTFDTDGTAAIIDSLAGGASITAMALQNDGKILLTGLGYPAGDIVVWRLKADGGDGTINHSLDPTFGSGGRAVIDSGGNERSTGIVVQPDTAIVVAGYTDVGPHGGEAAVYRLTKTGAMDTTFDTDGAAGVDSGGYAQAWGVGLQPDGKILLAGSVKVGTDPFTATLWRLKANGGDGSLNGALDTGFGTAGASTVTAGAGASADALALQPDRRVVVAGSNNAGYLLVFRALGDPFNFSVSTAGAGTGSVACTPACASTYDDGTQVTLTATPAAGSAFAGWSGGGCSGTGGCAVTMNADQAVTATFDKASVPPAHFALKAKQLTMKALRRSARRAKASVAGLPVATQVAASLVAGRTTLARRKAKAGAGGRATLTFTFSKKARKRLRSKKLRSVTFRVTVTPPADTASTASRKVKLRR